MFLIRSPTHQCHLSHDTYIPLKVGVTKIDTIVVRLLSHKRLNLVCIPLVSSKSAFKRSACRTLSSPGCSIWKKAKKFTGKPEKFSGSGHNSFTPEQFWWWDFNPVCRFRRVFWGEYTFASHHWQRFFFQKRVNKQEAGNTFFWWCGRKPI